MPIVTCSSFGRRFKGQRPDIYGMLGETNWPATVASGLLPLYFQHVRVLPSHRYEDAKRPRIILQYVAKVIWGNMGDLGSAARTSGRPRVQNDYLRPILAVAYMDEARKGQVPPIWREHFGSDSGAEFDEQKMSESLLFKVVLEQDDWIISGGGRCNGEEVLPVIKIQCHLLPGDCTPAVALPFGRVGALVPTFVLGNWGLGNIHDPMLLAHIDYGSRPVICITD